MTKFHGVVGYNHGSEEVKPGRWEENIVEKTYSGEVLRNTRRLQDGPSVNPDIVVQNSISVLADAYASEHFHAIRYVKWAGTLWVVTEVTEERPRLILRLGGVYHGPRPPDTP